MSEPSRFSELGAELPPALLRALTARGYDVATSVQAAVLDPAAHGRDLMVSSQTGSGKTIAFGAALASTLLEAAAPARKTSGAPRALVIVPTRELAAQVREELGWLLASTGLRLGSFTGGTAVSGDLRALHRGVDVAIGTPGRLVDLMSREKLVLAELEVVVLDEADEMLDLGFREDLETLLSATPATRRTLLLSATMPSEIRSLARRFQRDALAIDPRKAGDAGGGARAAAGGHDDITYVAHLIAGSDRLAAVVNLLRASGDARAIVFVTTRDAVGALHRELVARGFAATAISGERAQAERDRALDQVRQGEARILVATNVAARGLHLPDVDLIVHADLPLNAESLTHRSGRTGRAGRKGTAVVIASLAERRKAERLLAAAQVRVPWTTPPSAKQILGAARAHLIDSLLAESALADGAIDGGDAASSEGTAPQAAQSGDGDDLLAPFRGKISADDLARRLLARELERLPTGEKLLPIPLPSSESRGRFGHGDGEAPPRRRSPGEMSRDGVLFRVNLGAKDQADPRWLLPLICRRGGVTRREVGAIRIGPQETTFEIAGDAAADFALAARETDPRAPHVRVERVDGRGDGYIEPSRGRAAFGRAPAPAQRQRAAVEPSPVPAEPAPAAIEHVPAAPARPPAPAAIARPPASVPPAPPAIARPPAPVVERSPAPAERPLASVERRPARVARPAGAFARPQASFATSSRGPASDLPAHDRPHQRRSAHGQPSYATVFDAQASQSTAADSPPPAKGGGFGKPAHARPPHGKPAYGKPAYAKPAHGKAPYAKATHAKPHHGKPAHGNTPAHGSKPGGFKPGHARSPAGKHKG